MRKTLFGGNSIDKVIAPLQSKVDELVALAAQHQANAEALREAAEQMRQSAEVAEQEAARAARLAQNLRAVLSTD